MNALDGLIASAGRWQGTNTLHDPHSGLPEESPSTLVLTPVLAGRFVRVDYTWAYKGEPQEGSLLLGFDPAAGAVSGHWVDTWHMGRQVLACLGPAPDGETVAIRGSYPAPSGPDWGWRIALTTGGDALRVAHTNIEPDGNETPAVEALYARA